MDSGVRRYARPGMTAVRVTPPAETSNTLPRVPRVRLCGRSASWCSPSQGFCQSMARSRCPRKIGAAHQMRQGPGAVIVDVADEPELAAVFQECPPWRRRWHLARSAASSAAASARDQDGSGRSAPAIAPAPRPVARRRRRRKSLILPIFCASIWCQDFRHAVDIGLAADEPDVGKKPLRLRDQMLAAAEADFEPDVSDLAIEQLGKPLRRGRSDVGAPGAGSRLSIRSA